MKPKINLMKFHVLPITVDIGDPGSHLRIAAHLAISVKKTESEIALGVPLENRIVKVAQRKKRSCVSLNLVPIGDRGNRLLRVVRLATFELANVIQDILDNKVAQKVAKASFRNAFRGLALPGSNGIKRMIQKYAIPDRAIIQLPDGQSPFGVLTKPTLYFNVNDLN